MMQYIFTKDLVYTLMDSLVLDELKNNFVSIGDWLGGAIQRIDILAVKCRTLSHIDVVNFYS